MKRDAQHYAIFSPPVFRRVLLYGVVFPFFFAALGCNFEPDPNHRDSPPEPPALDRGLFKQGARKDDAPPTPERSTYYEKDAAGAKPSESRAVRKSGHRMNKTTKSSRVEADSEKWIPSHSFTVGWNAPSTKEDGSPLTDLAGYKVYLGVAPGQYATVTHVGNVTKHTFERLTADVYYVATRAYDAHGKESRLSDEIMVDLK